MLSTCRVVPGLSAMAPKLRWRVRVRSSEVLPTLVWPTTAISRGVVVAVMVLLGPGQGVGGLGKTGNGLQAGGVGPPAPALAVGLGAAGGRVGQPQCAVAGVAAGLTQEALGAAVGGGGGVAHQQQRARTQLCQSIEHAAALGQRAG